MSAFSDLKRQHNDLLSRQNIEGIRTLRRLITDQFMLSELKDLSFELGIDLDELQGNTQQIKTQELIRYAERYGILKELIDLLQKNRPRVSWPEILFIDVEEVENFIKKSVLESSKISSISEREELQSYLTFWSRYVYERTSIQVEDELLPSQDISLFSRIQASKWWNLLFISLVLTSFLISVTVLFIVPLDSGDVFTTTGTPAVIVVPPETATSTLQPLISSTPTITVLPSSTSTNTPIPTQTPTATTSPEFIPPCDEYINVSNDTKAEAVSIEPEIMYCGQLDDKIDVYLIEVTENVSSTVILKNPIGSPNDDPVENSISLFTSEDVSIGDFIKTDNIQIINAFLVPGEYFIVVRSEPLLLSGYVYSVNWLFSILETPVFTPIPTPPLNPPEVTSLELLPGGGLTVCWEWDGTLGADNNFAVRFWSINATQPEAKFSLVWQKEKCYQFQVNNAQFPQGDYFINVAVMEGPSSEQHSVLVVSNPIMINIPNFSPTLAPPPP